ncbi:hypothetical protein B0H14DRAFT_3490057 [Mycena olivaceomarginata]|nr:hypothetical protein B0H14DRAFT_3490057 [Mycena olivaceomarginata]
MPNKHPPSPSHHRLAFANPANTMLYHASLVPANLTDENPYWESPYPSYDAFFWCVPSHILCSSWDTSAAPGHLRSSWDTFRTMHPLSHPRPREWAGIVSSYVDGWWQTGYERWVLGLAHRRYPNGTFAFSPPNACSPVDPMGHSCARGMDNNVGFLNAALADAAAAFQPTPPPARAAAPASRPTAGSSPASRRADTAALIADAAAGRMRRGARHTSLAPAVQNS